MTEQFNQKNPLKLTKKTFYLFFAIVSAVGIILLLIALLLGRNTSEEQPPVLTGPQPTTPVEQPTPTETTTPTEEETSDDHDHSEAYYNFLEDPSYSDDEKTNAYSTANSIYRNYCALLEGETQEERRSRLEQIFIPTSETLAQPLNPFYTASVCDIEVLEVNEILENGDIEFGVAFLQVYKGNPDSNIPGFISSETSEDGTPLTSLRRGNGAIVIRKDTSSSSGWIGVSATDTGRAPLERSY